MEKPTNALGHLYRFGPLALFLTFTALSSQLGAQTTESIYLRLGNPDEIPGESLDFAHAGWIEIASYSDGLTVETARPGPNSNLPRVAPPIRMRKAVDRATPRLLHGVAAGTHYPVAEIHFVRGDFIYLRTVLTDVIITESSLDLAQPVPSREVLELDFNQIEMTYMRQLPDGSAEGTTPFTWSRVIPVP